MSAISFDDPARTTVSRRQMARAGAAAFVTGGLLFAAEGVADALSPGYPLATVLGPAVLLLLVGYLGFHAVHGTRTGRVGVVALALVVPGLLADAAGKAGAVPEAVAVIGVLAFMAGSVLFGVGTWRARIFPRWCALAFVLPLPLPLVVEGFGTAVTGLAYTALGVVLWARSSAAAPASAPVA
jgi:hypothetical protein